MRSYAKMSPLTFRIWPIWNGKQFWPSSIHIRQLKWPNRYRQMLLPLEDFRFKRRNNCQKYLFFKSLYTTNSIVCIYRIWKTLLLQPIKVWYSFAWAQIFAATCWAMRWSLCFCKYLVNCPSIISFGNLKRTHYLQSQRKTFWFVHGCHKTIYWHIGEPLRLLATRDCWAHRKRYGIMYQLLAFHF